MNPFSFLRLRSNPKPETPPKGNVDLFFDREDGVLKTRDPDGATAVVGGAAVNNPSVNAAIEADSAASRSSMQVARYVPLSSVCTGDTDLSLDGVTTGADQSTAAQSVLDLGQDGPLTVYWDVPITAAGLLVYPDTRIVVAPGCGAKAPDGINKPILSNANYAAGADQANWVTAPNFNAITKDENITIEGGIWNGNGGNQDHDSVAEGWHVALRFFNVEKLTLDGVTVYTPRTFSIHFCNANNVTARDCHIDCGTSGVVNRDGFHLNGNCTNFQILNTTARTWDDAIGINADDLEVQISPAAPSVFGPYANYGPINNIVVNGLQLTGGRFGVRMLSGLSRVDAIDIRNVTGAHGGHLALIDNYSESPSSLRNAGPGNFGRISIDGVNVSCTDPSLYKQCIIFVCATVESLTTRNVVLAYDKTGVDYPPVKFGATAGTGVVCAVTDFLAENFKLLGPTGTESTPLTQMFTVTGAATVAKMTLRGIQNIRRSSKTQPVGYIITTQSTSVVSDLTMVGVDAPLVATNAYTQNSSSITRSNVSGSNVFEAVRGGSLSGLVTRDARDPSAYTLSVPINSGSYHAPFGGGALVDTDYVFSGIVKLPASFTGGASVAFATRAAAWNYSASTMEGYLVSFTASSIELGKISLAESYTQLNAQAVSPTVSAEYYCEMSCVGTSISVAVQRLSDNAWLTSSATWQAAKTFFNTSTDSTYTGRFPHIRVYGGNSGSTKTARFRNLQLRPA